MVAVAGMPPARAQDEKAAKAGPDAEANAACLTCHGAATSYVISEWERSKHHDSGVGCFDCHGSDPSNPAAYEHPLP